MNKEDYTSLADVFRDGARLCPDKPALIFDHATLSYAELDRRSNRVAQLLREAGVGKGDRVALLAKNSRRFVEVLAGIAKAGAVFLPVNWRLSAPEIGFVLHDSGAAVLFVDAEFAALAQSADGPQTRTFVLDGDEATSGYERQIAAVTSADPLLPLSRSDLAMILYTSGTTGKPKGAMLSHGNFVRHCGLDATDVPHWVGLVAEDICLNAMPLFHAGAIEMLLRPFFTRATVVLHRDFEPARVLEDIARYRVSITGFVPTMLHHPDAALADLSSLKRMFYGAAPIPLDLLREAVARLGCEFVQAYGMTETSATCVMLPPSEHSVSGGPRMRAAGRAVLGTEMKIVDSDGRTLPAQAIGEVSVRCSGVMTAYWNRPDATKEVLSYDGWLRTGDAGYLDEDGYMFIHDRIKDMIVSGAENIYPAEVESAVYGHPDIEEVAVVGVPDPLWGEAVKAVVVAKPGHSIDAEDVITWTKGRIASFKAPRSVDVVESLPKNATGKVLRRMVRDNYWVGQERLVN